MLGQFCIQHLDLFLKLEDECNVHLLDLWLKVRQKQTIDVCVREAAGVDE